MNKKIALGIGLGLVVGIGSIGVLYSSRSVLTTGGAGEVIAKTMAPFVGSAKKNVFTEQKLNLLGSILEDVSINPIDQEKMIEGIYRGYVSGLGDRNTSYLTDQELTKLLAREDGAYMGTGIEFTWSLGSDYLVVTNVLEGSPAQEAGIGVGERILQIGDIKAKASNEVLLYEKLTDIEKELTYIVADGQGENPRKVSLKAALVRRQLLEGEMLKGNIGYIKLSGIKEEIAIELGDLLKRLRSEGSEGFILDMRNVESNLIAEMANIASIFISDEVLFYVDRGEEELTSYTSGQAFIREPVVVLANRETKGTVEALVGAMQSSKRATIVGGVTGKTGTVQQVFELEDGSGLSITIGNILTKDKEIIRDQGITPDVLKSPTTEESIEIVKTGRLAKENDSLIQEALKILTQN
jgi:carboxyl-terminal processing protease